MKKNTKIIFSTLCIIFIALILYKLFFNIFVSDNMVMVEIDIPNYKSVYLPENAASVISDDWNLAGVAISPDKKHYIYSTTHQEDFSGVVTKMYRFDAGKEVPRLIYESLKQPEFLRPSLWRADDKIVTDVVSIDLEHPYDELLISIEGKIITDSQFMRLFNVWDSNNRYFLTPMSTSKSKQVMIFPWAPKGALSKLIWEDVLENKQITVEENYDKQYTSLGISEDGVHVLYYEHSIDSNNQVSPDTFLYAKNLRTRQKQQLESVSIQDIQRQLDNMYPDVDFSIFEVFFIVDKNKNPSNDMVH